MKTLLTCLVALVATFSNAAAIKYYDDYPNNANPPDTYIISLQTGDKSVGGTPYNFWTLNQMVAWLQLRGFTNGTASITIITNNSFIYTTNITVEVPGGVTNLNLTPKTVMYADVNDAESSIPNASGVLTNNGTGGIGFSTTLSLTEIDAQNFYPTNMFTGITNAPVLATDGNGLLSASDFTGPTNYTLVTSNLLYLQIQAGTNGSLANATNNDLLFGQNATNHDWIIGQNGTNQSWAIGLNATNNDSNSTNFSLLIGSNDTNHDWVIGANGTNQTWLIGSNATNNDTVISLAGSNNIIVLSNNVLSEISGALVSATNVYSGNGSGLTNLTYRYTTNAIPSSGALTFGNAYFTNLQASVTLPAFTLGATFYETCVIVATNSTGSDTTFTVPAGVKIAVANGGGTTITVTNKSRATIVFEHYGNLITNAWANYF